MTQLINLKDIPLQTFYNAVSRNLRNPTAMFREMGELVEAVTSGRVKYLDATNPTVLLAESHLAVHTWPESGSVSLDLYVCNFSEDNTAKARALMQTLLQALAPVRVHQQQLRRGDASAAVAFDGGSGSSIGR